MRSKVPDLGGSLSGQRAGALLALAGVVLFVSSLVVGAALAPDVGAAAGGEARRTLVGSQGGGPGLHEKGSVYLLDGHEIRWRAGDTDSYFDVTMLDDGRVMAGFMDEGYTDCGPYDAPCARTGFRVIDPNADSAAGPEVVSEYSFPVRTRKNSEVHDVERLGEDRYLLTDMEHERILIVEDGAVAWQWNASERYDAPADPTRTDWLHINDVDVISEGRYLVSVRNAHQLVVVERGAGVVEVINEGDGGSGSPSPKGDPTVLRQQHNPQWLGNGTVLVADSHNDRIVELRRNESGDWNVAWGIREAGGLGFRWPRDADRLPNGNTLITDSLNKRIVEVNRTGEVVWSYQTPEVPYEAERLPAGETVGGVAYADTDAATAGEGDAADGGATIGHGNDVPVLSFLLMVVQTGIQTPYWFTEAHVAVALVALVCVLGGGGIALRSRLRG